MFSATNDALATSHITRSHWKHWLVPLIIGLACLIIEWPSLKGPFVFDDYPNLAALDQIKDTSLHSLGIYLAQAHDFPGRPLAMLSFLPQRGAWPNNPFPFKLANLLIHILCGFCAYQLVRQLVTTYRQNKPSLTTAVTAHRIAAMVMAAWLLHPMQMSTTMLVIQRMTELAGLFMLSGLILYIHAITSDQRSTLNRATMMIVGLAGGTLLASLSKESGILLAVYTLSLDLTILNRQVSLLGPTLRWLRRCLVYLPIAFVLVYLCWELPIYSQVGTFRNFSLSERLLTEARILFEYLGQILLPHYGSYSVFHDGHPVSRGLLTPPTELLAVIGIIAAVSLAIIFRRRQPLLSFSIFWFLGGHLLESTVIPLELYFEHRNYLPMLGPVFSLTYLVAHYLSQGKTERLLAGTIACAWMAGCLFATALTAVTWGNADQLALAWSKTDPASIRASHFLAERFYIRGQYDKALSVISDAKLQHPDSADLALSHAFLLCAMQKLDEPTYNATVKALATASFERGGFEYVSNLRELAISGRCSSSLTPETWKQLPEALLSNPAYTSYGYAVGYLHYQQHLLAVSQGDLAAAIEELTLSDRANPDADIPRLQAEYLASAGLYQQAIDTLKQADFSRLSLLRRLLVNDSAINQQQILLLTAKKSNSKNGL
jgi:tetratricopeptide (TPR) repeat protein